ncbi:keratin, type II cytoskeletal 2 epidermal-like [Trematomus bernacchii]|uniref:keratin, type II cytoskeletal 2 epidermal-like n=1 Tax=Trematomus bernacchii TaxID=40690 RepID=UPI00146E5377|nr:keratin, type II cytoskeletal 2 epidermal-like [Trematomus bernacchii]
MAGLCWMAVVLTFFMSAGDTLADVDESWLTSVIEGIKKEYPLGDTFSVAVNIPENQDIDTLQQVFQDDPPDKVKQTVSGGQVYHGTRVVAAARSEAVSQVLKNIQPFIKSSEGNFLIIYSEVSPCGPTCTTNANQDSSRDEINNVIKNWRGYAFAFSKLGDVPAGDTPQIAKSFKNLGISKLGLDKIFRCYNPGDEAFQCTSCFSDGDVTPSCVANNSPSNEEEGAGEATGTDTDTGAGTEIAPGEGIGAGIGPAIATGIGGRTGGGRRKGESGRVSRCKGKGGNKKGCKGRKGVPRETNGKGRRQCKRKGPCKPKGVDRRRKGSKVRKGPMQKGTGKVGGRRKSKGVRRGKGRGGGKVRGQSKTRGGRRGKGRGGGKVRRQSKTRGGRRGKGRGGGKVRRQSKTRGGRRGKGRGGGKVRRQSKTRGGRRGKGRGGGKVRGRGSRRAGGRRSSKRRSSSKRRGKRRRGLLW